MRGYFGIGIEGASKSGNMGNLIRTGHAFGAAFAFTVKPETDFLTGETVTKVHADTSKSAGALPFYEYDSLDEMHVPKGCSWSGSSWMTRPLSCLFSVTPAARSILWAASGWA